jgi:methyl-accepting chemotaxis protein
MLGNLRISSKLMIMVGLAVLGIGMVAAAGLAALGGNLLEDRKAKLQDVVGLASQALELDYRAAHDAGLSDAEAQVRSKALLRQLHFGKDDYFYALAMDGTVVAHPNQKLEGQNLIGNKDTDGVFFRRTEIELVKAGGSGFVSFRFPRVGSGEPSPKVVYVVGFKPYGWVISGGIYLDDVDAIFWSQAERIGVLIGIALLLVVAMSLALGHSIVKPITGMTAAMRRLASGDTAAAIPARERGDEVGAMAQSVQVFRDNMIETARLRGE